MSWSSPRIPSIVLLGALLARGLGWGEALAGSTERVNVPAAGGEATGGPSSWPDVSSDGRFVTFFSTAGNLVAPFGPAGVYVRDRVGGRTWLASLDSAGAPIASTDSPAISGDGRVVASRRFAGAGEVFVRDVVGGVTTVVSVSSTGVRADAPSVRPRLSRTGRFVTFTSAATNLVPGDGNGVADIFVHDRVTGATVRASVDSAGGEANGRSAWGELSADGRFVAFASEASDLVRGDTNGVADVFVKDLATGATTRVSVGPGGAQASGPSGLLTLLSTELDLVRISDDGRRVAFGSTATDLDPQLPGGGMLVYVHDRGTGATAAASLTSSGAAPAGPAFRMDLSGDGNVVAFATWDDFVVPDDGNFHEDVFVRDLTLGVTELVSADSAGRVGGDDSGLPALSFDGRLVAFASAADALVPADDNSVADVFVRDRGCAGALAVHGIGCPGGTPFLPYLLVGGCPLPGSTLTLEAVGPPAPATLLLVGTAQTETVLDAHCSLWVGPVNALLPIGPLPLPAVFELPIPPAVVGVTATVQLLLADAQSPRGFAATDALEVTVP